MKRFLFASAASALALLASQAQAQTAPPALDIVLKPHGADNSVDYVDVKIHLGAPGVKAGDTLVHLPLVIASRPGVPLEASGMQVSDAAGPVPMTQFDEAPTSTWTYRDFRPQRATQGDVTLSYRAHVHEVNSGSRNGPLFDLRGQPGGVNGGGLTFLALPDTKTPYAVDLNWDMSNMPAGSRGVHSLGEGEVKLVAPVELVNFSFYYAGDIQSFTPPSGKFTMYWTHTPPFDVKALAANIAGLYDYETHFFKDPGSSYRVFIRENPFHGTGGTALAKSFMFGYSSLEKPDPLGQQLLIAHEMTHNWPTMDGEHGDVAWYTEGTAEYYSLLLSWRAKSITADQYIAAINERIDAYFDNPLHTLDNADAAKAFWTDTRAQTVPYGRGLLYLINTDARIRAATKGQKSLDDVVLWILDQQRAGKAIGQEQWLAQVGSLIGSDVARADHDAMVAGTLDKPVAGALGACFAVTPAQILPYDLGFDPKSLDAHTIKGLEPDSAAAKAGLRDGDTIVETSDTYTAQHKETAHLTIKIRRGDAVTTIDYVPRRSTPVASFRWQRVPGVADADCKF